MAQIGISADQNPPETAVPAFHAGFEESRGLLCFNKVFRQLDLFAPNESLKWSDADICRPIAAQRIYMGEIRTNQYYGLAGLQQDIIGLHQGRQL